MYIMATFKKVSSFIDGDDSLTTYNNYPVHLKVLVKMTEMTEGGNWNFEVVDPSIITYESDFSGRCNDLRSDCEMNPYVELQLVNSKEAKYVKSNLVSKLYNKNIRYGVIDYIQYHIRDEYDQYIEEELKKRNLKRTTHNLTLLRETFIATKMNEIIDKYNKFYDNENEKTR